MSKIKFIPEDKAEIIQSFQSGDVPYSMLKERYVMKPNEIYKWIKRYEEQGISAFARSIGNSKYTQGYGMSKNTFAEKEVSHK